MVETNLNILQIEYDAAGARVPPRPNTPSLVTESLVISGGSDLAVQGNYPSDGEAGEAYLLQLFSRRPDEEYDFDSPEDQQVLGAGMRTGIKTAALGAIYTGGLRYICLKAATLDGTQGDASAEVLIDASTAVVPGAADLTADLARG